MTSAALAASDTLETPEAKASFYHQATEATTYWRCVLPAKYLPGVVLPAEKMVAVKRDDGRCDFPDMENGTAVIQFPGDRGAAMVTMLAMAQGGKVFVEVDDNYIDQGDELWRKRSNWGQQIGSQAHTVQGHRWICENASGVIVTTEALAAAYREHSDNVHVCRNSIDPDDWPQLDKPNDGVFRIGWYASPSHDRDGVMAGKAMAWASRQPNVQVVNIGLDPPGWAFPRWWIPSQSNFIDLRPELMKLDVGISPLVGTPSAKFRSDLKPLEYGMGATLPILQAAPPYADWHDKPALMCWTEKDWMEQVKWCVRNQDEVRALGQLTREYVLRERTFTTEIDHWRTALAS